MADDRHPVALNAKPAEAVNTLVLAGLDITFPLEADLDNDPEKDDVIRLWSGDGLYDRSLKKGDPDVEREGETDVLAYTFQDVPPGIYRLSVVVDDKQVDILRDIVVTRNDVLHDGKPLAGDYDAARLGTPDVEEDEDPYDPDLDTEIDESYYGLESD
jgi:hypothetical protein